MAEKENKFNRYFQLIKVSSRDVTKSSEFELSLSFPLSLPPFLSFSFFFFFLILEVLNRVYLEFSNSKKTVFVLDFLFFILTFLPLSLPLFIHLNLVPDLLCLSPLLFSTFPFFSIFSSFFFSIIFSFRPFFLANYLSFNHLFSLIHALIGRISKRDVQFARTT